MKLIYSFILSLFLASAFCQTTITLQPDAIDGKDAKVFSQSPSQNFGSDLDFIAATWTFSGDANR